MALQRRRLVVEDLLDDGVDLEDRPRRVNRLRLSLRRLVDEQGGTRVKCIARGGVVFIGPGWQAVPQSRAPTVVALDDEGGLGPTGRGLEREEELAEDAVGKGEVVEVGATAAVGVVVVDAAPEIGTMGNGEVEKDEVGLISAQQLDGVLL